MSRLHRPLVQHQRQPGTLQSIKGRGASAEVLIKYGADVNKTLDTGNTALMWAAKNGQMEIVKMLLEAKADHRIENHLGLMAADWAASRGHVEIFNLLNVLQ